MKIMANDDKYLLLGLALLSATMVSACSKKLSNIEEEGIQYIREIEKMARDVYLYFYDTWGIPIMNSISQSEQTHMDIVKPLIESYRLEDPVDNNDIGKFTNQNLQDLYSELIEQGSLSEVDALTVSSMIEEIDIIDIQNYLKQTDENDIATAYNTLLEGSRNHLRIFVSHLKDIGLEYQPNYLTQQDYDNIVQN